MWNLKNNLSNDIKIQIHFCIQLHNRWKKWLNFIKWYKNFNFVYSYNKKQDIVWLYVVYGVYWNFLYD